MSIFLILVAVMTYTIVAIPICVDLIFSSQLKAKCYQSLLSNARRSAGMKENECQGCLFPNRESVGMKLQPIPWNRVRETERQRNREAERDDILDG